MGWSKSWTDLISTREHWENIRDQIPEKWPHSAEHLRKAKEESLHRYMMAIGGNMQIICRVVNKILKEEEIAHLEAEREKKLSQLRMDPECYWDFHENIFDNWGLGE